LAAGVCAPSRADVEKSVLARAPSPFAGFADERALVSRG